MTTPLEEATLLLPDDQRDALFGAIPTLIAAVAGADRVFDNEEMLAVVDELLASETELGASFRHSPAAEAAFDVLLESATLPLWRDLRADSDFKWRYFR